MASAPKTSPLILLAALFITASAAAARDDLLAAMAEMQKANYFTFVMLLKMSAPAIHPTTLRNVTFLMPNDKKLSRSTILPESLSEFLLRHSIPSPLLFDHLERIPSGAIIPSSQPDYGLKVANGGRRSFYLNNVRIVSPNICASRWSSVRCHGIDGILPAESGFSSSSCSNITVPEVSPPLPSPPHLVNGDQVPAPAPAPAQSGSSMWRSRGTWELKLLVTFLLISTAGVST